MSKTKRGTLAFRAIRGAWAVAAHAGMVGKRHDGIMDTNEAVRHAMVCAWKAGYRNGWADGKRRGGQS